MGYFKNIAEGGTNGTNVSVANSGGISGTAFDTIVVNNVSANAGNVAFTYATSAALVGALGFKLVPRAAASYLRWTDPTPGIRGGVRRSYKHVAAPGAQTELCSIRVVGGGPLGDSVGAAAGAVVVTPTGGLAANTAGTTHVASIFTPTIGTTYQVELHVEKGTTTTNGKVWFQVYSADGSTVLHTWTATNVNTRSSNPYQYRWGGATAASTGWAADQFDSLQAGALESGYFSQLSDAARVLNVVVTTTGEPFSTATVTANLEPGSPAADSWAFTQISGPPVVLTGTGNTRTYKVPVVFPPGGTIVVQGAATKGSETTSKQGSATVLPALHWTRMHLEDWVAAR